MGKKVYKNFFFSAVLQMLSEKESTQKLWEQGLKNRKSEVEM